VAAEDRRRRQHPRAADGREEEVPQPSADGGGARHDGDRPLRQNGKRLGKTSAELGWILEDNKATNNIIRSVGGVHYKTHRIYEKAL
jgi:hypothetical protein